MIRYDYLVGPVAQTSRLCQGTAPRDGHPATRHIGRTVHADDGGHGPPYEKLRGPALMHNPYRTTLDFFLVFCKNWSRSSEPEPGWQGKMT
jgi:hypothetical protein